MAYATLMTATHADKIDRAVNYNQEVGVGTKLYDSDNYGIFALYCSITADATGEKAVTIPWACEVLDVIVQARAASGGGTATLKKGATAITDAIVMATDKAMVRAGSIDDAQSTLAAGDTVTVDCANAADRGLVTILVRKL